MSDLEKPLEPKRKRTLRLSTTNKNLKSRQSLLYEGLDDATAGDAVHCMLVKRSSIMDLEAEDAKILAKMNQRISVFFESTVAGKTELDHEDGDDSAELQTNGQAMVNLLNNCLGTGLLSTGFSVYNLGLLGGVLTIILSGLMNTYTMLMHMKSSKLADEDPSTSDAAKKALGNAGKNIQMVCFFGMGFCSMISYIQATRDAVIKLLQLTGLDLTGGHGPQELMVAVFLVLLLPPTLIRSLSNLATLSMIAFLCALIMVASIIICCSSVLLSNGIDSASINLFPTSFAHFCVGFPVVIMVFGNQAGSGVILGSMQDGSDSNVKTQASRCTAINVVLNIIIGCGVYLAFSTDTKSDVLLNLPQDSLTSIVARMCAVVLVVLSYTIMTIPCKINTIDALYGKNEALMEATWGQFYGVTLGLNVAALAASLCIPDLALIFAVNSALVAPALSWLVPCAVMLAIRARPETENSRPVFSSANLPVILTFGFGLLIVPLGLNNLYNQIVHPAE